MLKTYCFQYVGTVITTAFLSAIESLKLMFFTLSYAFDLCRPTWEEILILKMLSLLNMMTFAIYGLFQSYIRTQHMIRRRCSCALFVYSGIILYGIKQKISSPSLFKYNPPEYIAL